MSVATVVQMRNDPEHSAPLEAARAGLQNLLKHGSIAPAAVLTCPTLVGLAPGWTGDPSDSRAAMAVAGALAAAIESLPPPNPARALFGVTDAAAGKTLGERRAAAASIVKLQPDSFRIRRERRLLDDLAYALLVELARAAPDVLANPLGQGGQRRRVLVVAGGTRQAPEVLTTFLRGLGLVPIIFGGTWSRGPGSADNLRQMIQDAQAIVVAADSDSAAQASLWFEAGIATALAPDRTILVLLDGALLPVDAAAMRAIRMSGSREGRRHLRDRLIAAGCDADDGSFAGS